MWIALKRYQFLFGISCNLIHAKMPKVGLGWSTWKATTSPHWKESPVGAISSIHQSATAAASYPPPSVCCPSLVEYHSVHKWALKGTWRQCGDAAPAQGPLGWRSCFWSPFPSTVWRWMSFSANSKPGFVDIFHKYLLDCVNYISIWFIPNFYS